LGSSNSGANQQLLPESIIETSERRWFYLRAAMLGIMIAVIVLTGMTNVLHPAIHVRAAMCNSPRVDANPLPPDEHRPHAWLLCRRDETRTQ
jgi:hypothetical protein